MIEAYQAYELGRKSAEELVRKLKDALCCPHREQECHDILAMLAPYIAGGEDCRQLEEDIEDYFAWLGLRWAYAPCGPPPSTKKRLVLRALCNMKHPVPEDVFREVLGEDDNRGQGSEEL